MRKILSYSVILLIFSVLNSYSLQNENLETIVNKIQKKYDSISDFHAQFVQEAEVKALKTVQKAYGEVWFKKPGKMRWNYYKPTKDTIVSDGKTLWYYNQEEKQAMESSLDRLSGDSSSTTLLSGLGKIKELYNVNLITDKALNQKNSYLLELTSKDQKDSDSNNRVIINVNKNTTLVDIIYLYDPFGNQTKITLDNLEINKKISDKNFKFKPPKGTEIVKIPSTK